jgi:hypothetical protein
MYDENAELFATTAADAVRKVEHALRDRSAFRDGLAQALPQLNPVT